MRKSWSIVAVLLVAALALGACSKKEDDAKSDESKTTEAPSGGALAGTTVPVCSDIPYPPLEDFKEGSKTEFTGFDVDLLTDIARRAGGKVEFKVTPFDGIIPALNAKDCDIIASAMTITDERKEQVLFSDPYYDSKQSLVVRKDDAETFKTLPDLKGKVIGVQSETTGQAYAEKNLPEGATLKALPGSSDLFNALKAKDIDAILQDAPVNAFGVKQNPDFSYQQEFDTDEQYGFAVRKDDTETVDWINAGLKAARADGTYQKLYDQWMTVAK